MSDRPNLGQILQGFGRIDDEDQRRALEHQREHGGYFGEALLALGIVTAEELEFGLAAQFNLPYVFPDADSIDLDAAALVTPEWALSHLALPIARSGETLTVVVDSPIKAEPVAELEHRTGLEVELAIASPGKIRELIRDVFERSRLREEPRDTSVSIKVGAFLDGALAGGASRFGISIRPGSVIGWWAARGEVQRRTLAAGWAEGLEARIQPPVAELEGESSTHAVVRWETREVPVEVRRLATTGGEEILIMPQRERPAPPERFPPPPSGVVAEVRLLVRSGGARFAVSSDPEPLLAGLLPVLPSLVLEPNHRSAHLSTQPQGEEVFTIRVPAGGEERAGFLRSLRGFHLDAVTADFAEPAAEWIDDVVGSAAAVFVPLGSPEDRRALAAAGVGWLLHVRKAEGGRLEWSLKALPPR